LPEQILTRRLFQGFGIFCTSWGLITLYYIGRLENRAPKHLSLLDPQVWIFPQFQWSAYLINIPKQNSNLIAKFSQKSTCITLQSSRKEPSLIVSILFKVLVTEKHTVEYFSDKDINKILNLRLNFRTFKFPPGIKIIEAVLQFELTKKIRCNVYI